MTILKGQLGGMLDGVGVYRDRDRYLARALRTANRMEALVGEILSVSRMEAGAEAEKRERLELSALVSARLDAYAELLEQRGMTLELRLTPGVYVEGDAALLGRAVDNLLSNAVRYSPEGAEVRVTVRAEGGVLVLEVENTGVHISDGALPHLFDAFYREEGSRSRSTGGSGLGLYLVRMILERHGASCAIQNTAEGVRAAVRFGPADGTGIPAGDVVE